LSFCYRLIMAPPEVIDAVVAHEICHLAHMNHGPRFYALLDEACPGHRRAMAWLRENEDNLLL
jgi:predicted metal-dependent hydrolase